MEVISSVTHLLLVVYFTLPVSEGHGMMIEPAMRSSLWRYDYPDAVPNYNDNGLNCGGFTNQHERQQGRCGICGDPYQGPRDNEAGGKYAKGIIARTYKAGQYITVVSDITANHGGYIELKLCPVNNFQVKVTQQCLDQNILPIKGHGTRFYLRSSKKSDFKVRHTAKLPDYVTCRQCVLQWYWKAGQHSGIDPVTNKECIGCGKQEEFINCADIAITDQYGMFPSVTTAPPYQVTTPITMYDTYMFQQPGMFPEYFDELSPFYVTPPFFSSFNHPYMNNNGFMPPPGPMVGRPIHQPNMRNRVHPPTHRGGHIYGNAEFRDNVNHAMGFRSRMPPKNQQTLQSRPNSQPQNTVKRYPPRVQQRTNNHGGRKQPPHKVTRPFIARPLPTASQPVRTQVRKQNVTRIKTTQRTISKPQPKMQLPADDDSEDETLFGDLLEDEGQFLREMEFWEDFNKLLNASSPDAKEALYEMADEAENIEEFHRNIKLMLQMQNLGGRLQSSGDSEGDSDDSLDMDWLLAEAKDLDLDSDEKNILSIVRAKNREIDESSDDETDESSKQSEDKQNRHRYSSFNDENRILDDSDDESRDSFEFDIKGGQKQGFRPSSFVSSADYLPDSSDERFNKDYDSTSEQDVVDAEHHVDTHIKWRGNYQNVYFRKPTMASSFTRRINPWNANSLYRSNIDYDENDVYEEDDTKNKFKKTISNFPISTTPTNLDNIQRNKLEVNSFVEKSHDYTDSEPDIVENEIDDEDDKKWGKFTEENEKKEEDDWSAEVEGMPDIYAENVIVTARSKVKQSPKDEETEIENDNAIEIENEVAEKQDQKGQGEETEKGEAKTTEKEKEPVDTENEIANNEKEVQETNLVDELKEKTDNAIGMENKMTDDANNNLFLINNNQNTFPNLASSNALFSSNKGRDNGNRLDDIGEKRQKMLQSINKPPMKLDDPNETKMFSSAPQSDSSYLPGVFSIKRPSNNFKQTAKFLPTSTPSFVTKDNSFLMQKMTTSSKQQTTGARPLESMIRKRIQDKISKSIGQNEDAAGSTSKKELSSNLSKLVLKMFMNTKSSPPTCPGVQKSVCKPVSMWRKYQQVADWCNSMCPYGNCPSAVCSCTCEEEAPVQKGRKVCRAQSTYQEKSGELDLWCQKTCSSGDCPELLCVCT